MYRDLPSLSMIVTMPTEGFNVTSAGFSVVVSVTGKLSSASQMRSSMTIIVLHSA